MAFDFCKYSIEYNKHSYHHANVIRNSDRTCKSKLRQNGCIKNQRNASTLVKICCQI